MNANIHISQQKRRAEEARRIRPPTLDVIHTATCKILPTRNHLLEVIPKQARIAEIGVAFGDFSKLILEHAKPKELHLIDSWSSDRYSTGLDRIQDNFAREISNGTVVIKRGLSTKALEGYCDEFFDWIYIDTGHGYDLTLEELTLSSRKVKSGGAIAGHDYCVGNVVKPVLYGVIQACHKFCVNFNWRYQYLTLDSGGSFSFCLERLPTSREESNI